MIKMRDVDEIMTARGFKSNIGMKREEFISAFKSNSMIYSMENFADIVKFYHGTLNEENIWDSYVDLIPYSYYD